MTPPQHRTFASFFLGSGLGLAACFCHVLEVRAFVVLGGQVSRCCSRHLSRVPRRDVAAPSMIPLTQAEGDTELACAPWFGATAALAHG
eukprot:2347256-Rhodomonas_salina.1